MFDSCFPKDLILRAVEDVCIIYNWVLSKPYPKQNRQKISTGT